jgi:hypothetical protein
MNEKAVAKIDDQSGIVVRVSERLALPKGARLYENGLELPSGITFDDWKNVVTSIHTEIEATASRANCLTWAIADAINYGEAEFGEMYAQWVDQTDYAYGSLANIAWVGREVPLTIRQPELSFYQHQAVAPLDDLDAKQAWLKKAVNENLSGRGLSQAIEHDKILANGGDPTRYEVEKKVGRSVDAFRDLDVRQWAPVLWTKLLWPLRHLCGNEDYRTFLDNLKKHLEMEAKHGD